MRRTSWLCAVLLLCGAGSMSASDTDDLVAAEHRFAAAAAADGVRDAFLAVLGEDGVLFRPRPVNGREWFGERPSPPGVLAWEPVHAEVSKAGDLGYTTGPWRYDLDGREPSFGHYVSIWSRASGDRWQLVLDLGVSHGEPAQSARKPAIDQGGAGKRAQVLPAKRLARFERELAEADQAFSRLAAEKGASEAYSLVGAEEMRLYREGHPPFVGLGAARQALAEAARPRQAETVAAHVAGSGDLGYSYGATEAADDGQSDGFSYARIWKRDGDGAWKIVLDITNPAP